MTNSIIVTGGAGFIGSNFVLDWFMNESAAIINLDKLTYAASQESLSTVSGRADYHFVEGDINDRDLVKHLLERYSPRAIVHFAAESHVDRSILGPAEFVRTNIVGTFSLLEESRHFFANLSREDQARFRFLHISTDEVYGSLSPEEPAFNESTPFRPNSPYSASKAASDHLARAYYHTYGLPVVTTNCSNNYGPRQFPEKLIPLVIINALAGKRLPVYGDGKNVRDWLYVSDHCAAIRAALFRGVPGRTYNVGGRNEMQNLEVVRAICVALDSIVPLDSGSRESLIEFVADRPGHDRRYAIDATRIEHELGWTPSENFASGIRKTVDWYLCHPDWVRSVTSGK